MFDYHLWKIAAGSKVRDKARYLHPLRFTIQQPAVIAHRRFAYAGHSGAIPTSLDTHSSNHLDNNNQE